MKGNTSDIMKKILENYPEIWKDRRLFQAVVGDLLPGKENLLLRNLLSFCVEQGIPDRLSQKNSLEKSELNLFVDRLNNAYGCTRKLATKAVMIWAEALLVSTLEVKDVALVIQLSQTDQLREKIKEQKASLIQAVTQRDELRDLICPKLQTEYILCFGELELELYEAKCQYKKQKRQIEMMQSRINRQEEMDLEAIKEIIEEELGKFLEKMEEEKEQIKKAKENKKKQVDDRTSEKIKKIYRNLMKKLHPDIHPDQTKEDQLLFQKVVEAYKNNNLKQLELLNEISNEEEVEWYEESIEELEEEVRRLQGLIEEVQGEIEQIKSTFPYTAKAILQDDDIIRVKKESLQRELLACKQKIRNLSAKIQAMEKEHVQPA